MRPASRWWVRPAVHSAGWVLGVGILVFLLIRLRSLWSEHHIELARADLGLLAAVLIVTAGTVLAAGVIWVQTLRWLGVDASWGWTILYLRAQLGKYLPGGVWQYVGRVAMARLRGAAPRVVTLSLAIEFSAGAAVAAVVGFGALYPWPALAVAVATAAGALVVHRYSRASYPVSMLFSRFVLHGRGAPAHELVKVTTVAVRVFLLFAPLWVLHGVSLWLLARALSSAPLSDLAYYIGAFAISWLAGLAAVIAPGGIGVREGVLTAFLTTRIGPADAIVVAVASRMAFVAVDLVGGVTSFLPALHTRLQTARGRASGA